ncbi:hypothetical protein M124_1524 [Bacteroides fragilis str. 3988T(B)14]|uniref:Uncharacterized protein n=1 Tax=Bacteroides fragilis str. 3988T(B)14 TaxID=1339315 RepID=A0A015W2K9_BACFG|nr:hypothetical protein M124_1524 [Bacteroides fragilis str. 3988T(B)14]
MILTSNVLHYIFFRKVVRTITKKEPSHDGEFSVGSMYTSVNKS